MTPLKLLQLVVEHLRQLPGCYAVAGGLAASFYRRKPRLTNDVDIAFCTGTVEESKTAAKNMLVQAGLKPAMGWIASGEAMPEAIALVIGRLQNDEYESTVDLLLPVFPWVRQAIQRAQHNVIDFGFAGLPTVTPEDLILAKAFALSIEKNRFTDLDDIQALLHTDNRLDAGYLAAEFERLQIPFPQELKGALPNSLKRLI